MSYLIPIKLIATGKALPSQQISSAQLDVQLGKREGYVQKYTGIDYRYHASMEEGQAQLGAKALQQALLEARIPAASIDLLISASAIPVQALPCTATHILRHSSLLDGTPGFDINMSCASFVVALHVAAGFLQTGSYKRIAIVSSELASRGLNWEDEESSLIFGDGAACAIVELGDGSSGILSYHMQTYAKEGDFCEIRAGGTRCNAKVGMVESDFYFRMDGRKVFKMAAAYIKDFQTQLLSKAESAIQDIDWVIPHQGSHLGIMHIHKILGIETHKVVNIYKHHGNQVAASIPTALHEMVTDGRWQSGNKVMLMGTAASLSLAALIWVV